VSRTILPFSAQIIGGSVTAVSLAGSRLYDDTTSQGDVVEGWLVLGATPSQAVRDIGRRAATRALIPALDQTRSAGLVVLPGAFVGMLLGGASPVQAAEVQLLALFGLIAAESLAVVVITRLLGPLAAARKPVPVGV
jgi:putative ABC transport system permease protein